MKGDWITCEWHYTHFHTILRYVVMYRIGSISTSNTRLDNLAKQK